MRSVAFIPANVARGLRSIADCSQTPEQSFSGQCIMKTVTSFPRLLVITLVWLIMLLYAVSPLLDPRSRAFSAEDGIIPVPIAPLLPDLPRDPPTPVVKIKVRVPACSTPGRTILYHICVENCS